MGLSKASLISALPMSDSDSGTGHPRTSSAPSLKLVRLETSLVTICPISGLPLVSQILDALVRGRETGKVFDKAMS